MTTSQLSTEVKANTRLVTPKRQEAVDKDKLRYALNATDKERSEAIIDKAMERIRVVSEEAGINAWSPSQVWDEFSRRLAKEELITFARTKRERLNSIDMRDFQSKLEEARTEGKRRMEETEYLDRYACGLTYIIKHGKGRDWEGGVCTVFKTKRGFFSTGNILRRILKMWSKLPEYDKHIKAEERRVKTKRKKELVTQLKPPGERH